MLERQPTSISTVVVRPGRATHVTAAAWSETLRRAVVQQANEVRLAGTEPLLAPGMIDALRASAPTPLPIAVETHGLAWIAVPPEALAALPIARWELMVPTLDPDAAAAWLDRAGSGASLRQAWNEGAWGERPVDVTWQPAPADAATAAALPAWVSARFGPGARLSVAAPRGVVRAALLERQFATLAAANRTVRLRVTYDRALPSCVRHHLPGAEAELPGGEPAGLAPALHPVVCRACPHGRRGRCAGLPAGWRVEGDDSRRLRQLARLPAFRTGSDAELVALRLGLRDVVRLALPARQVPLARLALETEEWTVVSSGVRELDADGNLFVPGEQPSTGLFAPGGRAGTVHVLYVAHDEARARQARDVEATIAEATRADVAAAAHRELGALLGYPACCVEAFVSDLNARAREAEDAASHFAHARAAATRSARLEPLANPFLVARDRTLLSHAPCAYDCRPTVALAAAVLAELRARDPADADARLAALTSAVALHDDGSVLVAHVDEHPDGPRLREILRAEGRFEALRPGDGLPGAGERTLVLRFDLTPPGSQDVRAS